MYEAESDRCRSVYFNNKSLEFFDVLYGMWEKLGFYSVM